MWERAVCMCGEYRACGGPWPCAGSMIYLVWAAAAASHCCAAAAACAAAGAVSPAAAVAAAACVCRQAGVLGGCSSTVGCRVGQSWAGWGWAGSRLASQWVVHTPPLISCACGERESSCEERGVVRSVRVSDKRAVCCVLFPVLWCSSSLYATTCCLLKGT